MSEPARDWRPIAGPDALRARAALLRATRAFFDARGVLEVQTPALAEFAVTDPHIAAIPVTLAALPDRRFFLQVSPEYAMKRLLADGSPDIYQVSKVFRDGERGRLHQPEFTMIEWYRRGFSLDAMIVETCELIATLLAAHTPSVGASRVARYRYAHLFSKATGLDPLEASVDQLRDRALALVPELSTAGAPGTDRSDWLDLLVSHAVHPTLPPDELAVVHHYPAAQGALARLDPDDPRYAERFEVFYRGVELANGYRELTDAAEQRQRFAADRRRRAATHLPDMLEDPHLVAALEHGLPECSGVAVGFDRLLMCALGAATIDEVLGFPL